MIEKLKLTIPYLLAIASGVLSISEENPANILGWLCFLCLLVYLVVNQTGNLFWKFFSIAAGWIIFVGIRLIVLGLQELLFAEFSYDIAGSILGMLIGLITLLTGVSLHRRKQKSFVFTAIISILFLTGAINSYLQLSIPITELPFTQILRIAIWLSIIVLLIIKSAKKLDPIDNL